MAFRLVSYPNNHRVKKCLIAGEYNGVKINVEDFDMASGKNKSEGWYKVNPFGQVPTAFTSEEEGLFESNSILRYVARLGEEKHSLYGKSLLETSRIDAFLDVGLTYDNQVAHWIYPILGFMPLNEGNRDESIKRVKTILAGLNRHLTGKEFLVGSTVTLADIAMTCHLLNGFVMIFSKEYLADVPEVVRWFRANLVRPEFKAILGDVALLADK